MKRKASIVISAILIIFALAWQSYQIWAVYTQAIKIKSDGKMIIANLETKNYQESDTGINKIILEIDQLNKFNRYCLACQITPQINRKILALDKLQGIIKLQKNNINQLLQLLENNRQPFDNWPISDRQQAITLAANLSQSGDQTIEILNNLGLNIDRNQAQIPLTLLKNAQFLAGNEKPINYLILFQDNAEIRPTGGLWGSYAILTIEAGVAKLGKSYPIDLPGDVNDETVIPADVRNTIGNITKEPFNSTYINSISEFPQTTSVLVPMVEDHLKTHIDATIGIDLLAMEDLLKLTGPIDFGSFGQVTADTLVSKLIYAPYSQKIDQDLRTERKAVMGDIGVDLFNRMLKVNLFSLNTWLTNQSTSRHLLITTPDIDTQADLSKINISGEFIPPKENFALLEEINFSGKQSLFIDRTVSSKMVNRGIMQVNLQYHYRDDPLAKQLIYPQNKSIVRLRVPVGSKLINTTSGYLDQSNQVSILNTTAFSDIMILNPGETKTITFKYKLPENLSNSSQNIKWLVQPGISVTK